MLRYNTNDAEGLAVLGFITRERRSAWNEKNSCMAKRAGELRYIPKAQCYSVQ